MKRKIVIAILAVLTALCLSLGLAACGGKDKNKDPGGGTQTEQPGGEQGGGSTTPGGGQGGGTTPGGEQGGGTTPGGEQGGGTTPGGDEGGGSTTPGGDEGGGSTTPGGEQGGSTTPGGDEGGGSTTPGGDEGGGSATPGGDEGGGSTTPGGDDDEDFDPETLVGEQISAETWEAAFAEENNQNYKSEIVMQVSGYFAGDLMQSGTQIGYLGIIRDGNKSYTIIDVTFTPEDGTPSESSSDELYIEKKRTGRRSTKNMTAFGTKAM